MWKSGVHSPVIVPLAYSNSLHQPFKMSKKTWSFIKKKTPDPTTPGQKAKNFGSKLWFHPDSTPIPSRIQKAKNFEMYRINGGPGVLGFGIKISKFFGDSYKKMILIFGFLYKKKS